MHFRAAHVFILWSRTRISALVQNTWHTSTGSTPNTHCMYIVLLRQTRTGKVVSITNFLGLAVTKGENDCIGKKCGWFQGSRERKERYNLFCKVGSSMICLQKLRRFCYLALMWNPPFLQVALPANLKSWWGEEGSRRRWFKNSECNTPMMFPDFVELTHLFELSVRSFRIVCDSREQKVPII